MSMAYIKLISKIFLHILVICSFVFNANLSFAQKNTAPIIIRDTEIENIFKEWMEPLLKAADIGTENVNLVLVQSSQVNAFVAGGSNIFVYTGLIEKTENPIELIGVLAHELGHISGGHLISTRAAFKRASYESILGMVLGIGAAIATGNTGAATAIINSSNNIAQRHFLSYSRINESSADQAAFKFLEKANINPSGLGSFLKKLEANELLPSNRQLEYVRTHPLTRNRIDALQTRINASTLKNKAIPKRWNEQHARMKAKLIGFIDPGRVPWVYNDRDLSIAARSARAIAAYKKNEIKTALKDIDALIALEPNNPYFQELKAQMLVAFGKVHESLPYYQKAVSLIPTSGLIRIDYGHALLEAHTPHNDIKEAIKQLKLALHYEPRSGKAHRLLATAYGRNGAENIAKLHLAEEAVLQRRLPYAKRLAEFAIKSFDENSHEWLQAKDILTHIQNLKSNSK